MRLEMWRICWFQRGESEVGEAGEILEGDVMELVSFLVGWFCCVVGLLESGR